MRFIRRAPLASVVTALIALAALPAWPGCNNDLIDITPDGPTRDLASAAAPDLSPPCPEGKHLLGDTCVTDGLECATEFPCDNGLQCIAGRCVSVPGPCKTNDDCPSGYQCNMGNCAAVCPTRTPQCKADADCGPERVCLSCLCVDAAQCATATGDVDGNVWTTKQDLHIDEALGQFGQTFSGIMKKLRDGILNCPAGSSSDCPLFQLIAKVLPNWTRVLILAIGNLADVLDNHHLYVRSQMLLTKNPQAFDYNGMDHWVDVSFIYQNMIVTQTPEKMPQIGHPVFVPFKASLICGVLYVDKHIVDGVLSGLLRWIVDSVVEYETCAQGLGACYHTLSDAIDGGINCSKVSDPTANKACVNFRNGLKQTIESALGLFTANYSFMTLKGTAICDIPARNLSSGQWEGTLGDGTKLFQNFTGEWSATR